jgi:hypothetical protein
MLTDVSLGMRVSHPDLQIGKVVELNDSKMVVQFGRHDVQFSKDEPSLSVVEKGHCHAVAAYGLGSKGETVLSVMKDGLFRSLQEISELSEYESLTGLSACIRAFRKSENGGHTIDKRKREGSNEYEYRLVA